MRLSRVLSAVLGPKDADDESCSAHTLLGGLRSLVLAGKLPDVHPCFPVALSGEVQCVPLHDRLSAAIAHLHTSYFYGD